MSVMHRDVVGLLDDRHDRSSAGPEAELDEHPEVGPGIAPRRLRAILRATDLVASSVAWLVALTASGLDLGVRWLPVAGAGIATLWLLGAIRGLYLARVSSVRSLELAKLLGVCAWSAVAGTLAARVALGEQAVAPLAVLLAVAFLGQFTLLTVGRSIYDDWLKQHRARGENCRRVVLIGYDDALASLCATLRDHPEVGFRVVGYFGPDLDDGGDCVHPLRLGDYADVSAWLDEDGASGAVVSAAALASSQVGDLVRELLAAGVHVDLSPGLAGIDSRRLRALPLAHEPLLYIEPGRSTLDRERVKRVIDLLLAPLALLVASPVLLVSMLAVKLGDGGPVFYSQERVGRHGRTFRMWKLRTMVVDADRRRDELDEYNARTGPLFKAVADPRVTPVGRILRALSLDEVPQLFNVLSGRMTLVGPRPALPAEVEEFDVELLRRLDVVPGLTGLWQVEARDNPNFSAYRRLDLFYLDNWSVTLDLVILLLTLHVVVIRATHALAGRFHRVVRRDGGVVPATGTLDG